MANQDDALKQINKSGFPFQLKIEDEIRNSHQAHQWSVEYRERPWISDDKSVSGFIDIVLKHDRHSILRLVIECKRIKADDARQLRWIFLLPDQKPQPTDVTSCFEVEMRQGPSQASTSSVSAERDDIQIWDNVRLSPASLQSEFCIIQGDEPRRQPIIENLANEVLESIEGLAQEEVRIARSVNLNYLRFFIFPAIITNAEIAVCQFKPSSVKINDGTLDEKDVEISPVPFIRFRKSLSNNFPQGSFSDLQSANKARERTVFIVNAASLTQFLSNWEINPFDAFEGYAYKRLNR